MKSKLTLLSLITLIGLYIPGKVKAQPGKLDSSFGINGIVYSSDEGGAASITTQKDGKILVAGNKLINSNGDYNRFAVRRYNIDGSVDGNFGVSGIALADLDGPSVANAVVVDSTNKIITAGIADHDFALAKFKTNGTLDSSFGIGGKVKTDFLGFNDEIKSSVILQNKKILTVGNSFFYINNKQSQIAIARYTRNGKLDSTFGIAGKITTNLNTDSLDFATAVIIQGGKFIVAGYTFNQATGYDFVLIRYKSNGTIDSSFGTNGLISTDFGGSDYTKSAAVQSNGKIVVSGYTSQIGGIHYPILARYTFNGKLDKTFGSDGKLIITRSKIDYSHAMAIQKDDKIIITGTTKTIDRAKYDMFIEAITKNGMIDSTFGTNGKTKVDFGFTNDESFAITIQQDGKFVITGYSEKSFINIGIARFQGYSESVTKHSRLKSVKTSNLTKHLFSIYPNPTTSEATLSFYAKGKYSITVEDITGRVMQSVNGLAVEGINVIQLLLNKFPPGFYLVKINDKTNNIQTLKLIKR